MQDKVILIMLGWALCSTGIAMYCIWLLFKKPTTHNEIANLKQKTKRNIDSNIKNNISPQLNSSGLESPKKEGLLKRIKNKRLLKKAANNN